MAKSVSYWRKTRASDTVRTQTVIISGCKVVWTPRASRIIVWILVRFVLFFRARHKIESESAGIPGVNNNVVVHVGKELCGTLGRVNFLPNDLGDEVLSSEDFV